MPGQSSYINYSWYINWFIIFCFWPFTIHYHDSFHDLWFIIIRLFGFCFQLIFQCRGFSLEIAFVEILFLAHLSGAADMPGHLWYDNYLSYFNSFITYQLFYVHYFMIYDALSCINFWVVYSLFPSAEDSLLGLASWTVIYDFSFWIFYDLWFIIIYLLFWFVYSFISSAWGSLSGLPPRTSSCRPAGIRALRAPKGPRVWAAHSRWIHSLQLIPLHPEVPLAPRLPHDPPLWRLRLWVPKRSSGCCHVRRPPMHQGYVFCLQGYPTFYLSDLEGLSDASRDTRLFVLRVL